jgi:hypothetical protein
MIPDLLETMTARARLRGMTDREWAAAAGLRHETLSRVKRRATCDAATLAALAEGCGLALVLRDAAGDPTSSDGLMPAHFSREAEERLLALCARGDVEPAHWGALGPTFFVAGVANLVASANGLDPDGRFARLAETLHPGVRSVGAFSLWLTRSPIKPSRFLPMLRQLRRLPATVPA